MVDWCFWCGSRGKNTVSIESELCVSIVEQITIDIIVFVQSTAPERYPLWFCYKIIWFSLFFSFYLIFVFFISVLCARNLVRRDLFRKYFLFVSLFYMKMLRIPFWFPKKNKSGGEKQTINQMENRFMNLSHGKNNTSITISNQYNSRKFDFDSVCKSLGRKISIMSASAAFSGFSISSVFFFLFQKVPQKTTIARFEYNENKMAKLNHNWKNNNLNNNNDVMYACFYDLNY